MSKYNEPRKIQLWNTKHFVEKENDGEKEVEEEKYNKEKRRKKRRQKKKKKIMQQVSKNSANIFVD